MANVLIVDDEQSIRQCLDEFLRDEGHEVFTAQDGRAGIRVLSEHKIDVVISDIVMPKLSGMDLLQHIRKKGDDIQVILITGQPTVETASTAVKYQAFAYLVKPFRSLEVCQTVAAAYHVKELRDEKLRLEAENQRILKYLEHLVIERTASLAQANSELLHEIEIRTKVQNELRDSCAHLVRNLDQTAHALSLAIEKRDYYTAGHQARVASLATAVAKAMGMPADSVGTIQTAASLHDVGKISIPAEFLSKPAALDPEEMALMRKHPRIGWEIVRSIDFQGPVANIVLQHHERRDGSGYPDGLTGSNILIEAQVVAVADIVEAMTHHRPYRDALGLEVSLKHIAENAPIFGPKVVETCLAVFADGFAFTGAGSKAAP